MDKLAKSTYLLFLYLQIYNRLRLATCVNL